MTKVLNNKVVLSLLSTLVSLGVSTWCIAQTVYKVTQDDGTILYTDQPVPGSIAIDLSGVSSSTVPTLAVPPPAASARTGSNTAAEVKYKVQVVSPTPEATIRDNAGQMAITATISPQLDSGQFHLYLDNNKVASQNFGSFILDGINRGAHTFFVSVTDNTGKTLASSEPQTFYMHQVSVLTRPNNAN